MKYLNDLQALQAQGRYADALLAIADLQTLVPEDEPCRALGVACAEALGIPELAARQHVQQAKAWQLSGDFERARLCLLQALKRWPRLIILHLQLASFHEARDELALAADYLRQALALEPNHAVAWNNLGNLLKTAHQHKEAQEAYGQALRHNPEMAEAHNNLANLYKDLLQPREAEWHYRRAIALRPPFFEARNNFGVFLHDQGREEEAIQHYRQAIEIDPQQVSALNNLAGALMSQLRFSEAEAHYQQALALKPDYAEGRFNWAICRLTQGKLNPETWAGYEVRYNPQRRVRMTFPPAYPFPMWQGQPLQGKRILVWKEQGLGDQIMFVRYLGQLKALGARSVVLVCHRALISLFQGLDGVDVLATEHDAIPWCDYWTYTMSLPGLFDTCIPTIPANIPYLHPKSAWLQAVRTRLAECLPNTANGLRVGVCWKGSSNYARDHLRSPGLLPFAALFKVPGVQFFSLLPDSRDEFLTAAGAAGVDWGDELDALSPPFEETAALLHELDLVITSDTSIAHLAGALGRPTWVVLPHFPYWTWMLANNDSPWYPNMRLFRQNTVGVWADLFEHMAAALRAHLALEQTA